MSLTKHYLAISFLGGWLFPSASWGALGVDPSHKFCWSENLGWMNWLDANGGIDGATFDSDHLSGSVWTENGGWLNVGNGSGPYANTDGTDFGVNILANNDLDGFAWGENIGWVNFGWAASTANPNRPRLDMTLSRLRGWAWSENEGWINLDDSLHYVGIECPMTEPPDITSLQASQLLIPIDTVVEFSSAFTGRCCEPYTAEWNFGDGWSPKISGDVTSPTLDSHSYAIDGIHTMSVTITDSCGNSATDSLVVVVYDPSAGFTTGGGWFIPDSGSYIDGEIVTDTESKAHFGFVVKYKRGAGNLDANLEFIYQAGDINLHSTDVEWLVVQSATKVRFKGQAMMNGEGPYTFKVTAEDNGEPGTDDTFQIEIWMGVVDTENGPPMPKHKAKGLLGGGNIKIHD